MGEGVSDGGGVWWVTGSAMGWVGFKRRGRWQKHGGKTHTTKPPPFQHAHTFRTHNQHNNNTTPQPQRAHGVPEGRRRPALPRRRRVRVVGRLVGRRRDPPDQHVARGHVRRPRGRRVDAAALGGREPAAAMTAAAAAAAAAACPAAVATAADSPAALPAPYWRAAWPAVAPSLEPCSSHSSSSDAKRARERLGVSLINNKTSIPLVPGAIPPLYPLPCFRLACLDLPSPSQQQGLVCSSSKNKQPQRFS